jgi:hypothetical protein
VTTTSVPSPARSVVPADIPAAIRATKAELRARIGDVSAVLAEF